MLIVGSHMSILSSGASRKWYQAMGLESFAPDRPELR